MLYTAFFLAAATFSSVVSAQSNDTNSLLPPGVQECCTVDAGIVPPAKKQQWCQAQRNTCPELCGGIRETEPQSCDTVGTHTD